MPKQHYSDQDVNDELVEMIQDVKRTDATIRAAYGDPADYADDGMPRPLTHAQWREAMAQGDTQIVYDGRTGRRYDVDYRNAVPNGAAPPVRPDRYTRAYSEWLRRGERMSGEGRDVLSTGFRALDTPELRAMGEATGSAGAQLVPAAYGNYIINVAKMYSGLYESGLPTILNTRDGRSMTFPVNDDTGNAAAQVAENADVTTAGGGADPTFTTVTMGAWNWAIKPIRVSFQLLQDQSFDLENWLGRAIAVRMGRGYAPKFINGAGTTEAKGLMTGITVGVTGGTGQATTIKWADIVGLVSSVDAAYQQNGAFLTSPSGLAMLRNVVDDQHRPILVQDPNQQNGLSILGQRVVLDANVPVPAANAQSLVYGDIGAAYCIRQVRDVMLLRLSERYAEFGQVGFLAFLRIDGQPLVQSAVKSYKHSA